MALAKSLIAVSACAVAQPVHRQFVVREGAAFSRVTEDSVPPRPRSKSSSIT
jgi:hypothetical protein